MAPTNRHVPSVVFCSPRFRLTIDGVANLSHATEVSDLGQGRKLKGSNGHDGPKSFADAPCMEYR